MVREIQAGYEKLNLCVSPVVILRMVMAKMACRMLKMAVQRGRSERRGEAYPQGYVEPLSDARTSWRTFSASC